MPTFEFGEWLTGLVIANLILLALCPFAFRGATWIRPIAYVFAVIMMLNGVGHTLGTIFGRTVASVPFARPMPGFYSSPALDRRICLSAVSAAGFGSRGFLIQILAFARCWTAGQQLRGGTC